MGLFSRKKTGFGLDVGSSAVKLVQLQEGSKGFALEAFAMVELPPDVIGEGMIKDPPVVVDAIKEVAARAKVKTKDAVLSVSGRELIMKKIQLPKVTAKELGDAIMLEAEHHINLPIDEVYLDHQVVGQSAGQGGTMDVMLVAVKKSKINEYVAVVEEAGLTPVMVDVDAFALQNQYEMNSPETTAEAVALIDIYTRAIAQRLNIPFERAEAAKKGEEVSGVRWDDLVPSLEAVSRELSLEIQRTFDYFASTAESERISRIVLSGGCAKLSGIDEFLSSSWGIPVEVVKPFQNVQFDPNRFPADDLYAAGPLLAVAVGLGMRNEGDKPA
jgi:type IV pilus assembly protein PilM